MGNGKEYLLLSLTKLSPTRKVRAEECHYTVDDLHGVSGMRTGNGIGDQFHTRSLKSLSSANRIAHSSMSSI